MAIEIRQTYYTEKDADGKVVKKPQYPITHVDAIVVDDNGKKFGEETEKIKTDVSELSRQVNDIDKEVEEVGKEVEKKADKEENDIHIEDFIRFLKLLKEGSLGSIKADQVDMKYLLICGVPETLIGAGTPSEAVRPDNLPEDIPWAGEPFFVGQKYINKNASSSGLYYAINTTAVSGWKQA